MWDEDITLHKVKLNIHNYQLGIAYPKIINGKQDRKDLNEREKRTIFYSEFTSSIRFACVGKTYLLPVFYIKFHSSVYSLENEQKSRNHCSNQFVIRPAVSENCREMS